MANEIDWSQFQPETATSSDTDWSQFKPAPEKAGVLRKLADVALEVPAGAANAIKAGVDAFGAGSEVATSLGNTAQMYQEMQSPARQFERQAQAQRSQSAEATGSGWEEAKAAGQNFIESPISAMAGAAGSIVPVAASVLAAAPLGVSALATGATVGLGMGLGAVKGSVYEDLVTRGKEAGLTPEEALAQADAAQAYFGPNMDQIGVGGALGILAGTTGVEKVLGGATSSIRSLAARTLAGMGQEALPEAAQGGQEKLAANIAAQRAGYDASTWGGVAGQATAEGLASTGPGGVSGAMTRFVDPNAGPISRAANIAQQQQAAGLLPAPGQLSGDAAIQMGQGGDVGDAAAAYEAQQRNTELQAARAAQEQQRAAVDPGYLGQLDGTALPTAAQQTEDFQASPSAQVPAEGATSPTAPATSSSVIKETNRVKDTESGTESVMYDFGDGAGFATVRVTGGKGHLTNIQLGEMDDSTRGKGIGTAAYEQLGRQLASEGVTLESTRWSAHQTAISPAALRVWEKLAAAGLAHQTGTETGKVVDRFTGLEEVREIPTYDFGSAKAEAPGRSLPFTQPPYSGPSTQGGAAPIADPAAVLERDRPSTGDQYLAARRKRAKGELLSQPEAALLNGPDPFEGQAVSLAQPSDETSLAARQEAVEDVAFANGDDPANVQIYTSQDLPDGPAGNQRGAGLTRSAATVIEGLGRVFGTQYRFYDAPGAAARGDGFVLRGRRDGVAYLRATEGDAAPLVVAGHETYHTFSPQERTRFSAAIEPFVDASDTALVSFLSDYTGGRYKTKIAKLVKSGVTPDQIIESVMGQASQDGVATLTRGTLREEFDADIFGNRMKDVAFWEKVFTELKAQDRTLLVKIRDAIKQTIAYLKSQAGKVRGFDTDQYIRNLDAVQQVAARTLLSVSSRKESEQASRQPRAVVRSPVRARIGPFTSAKMAEGSRAWQAKQGNTFNVEQAEDGFYLTRAGAKDEQAGRLDQGRSTRAEVDAGAGRQGDSGSTSERRAARGDQPPARQSGPRSDLESRVRRSAEGAVSLAAVHFSREQRQVLDGRFYGQGLKGAEARRLEGEADRRLHERVYAYVNEGAGVTPESGVGSVPHELELSNLYDLAADPLGFRMKHRGDVNGQEKAILDAGFAGYYSKGAFPALKQGAAVVLGDASHAIVPKGEVVRSPVRTLEKENQTSITVGGKPGEFSWATNAQLLSEAGVYGPGISTSEVVPPFAGPVQQSPNLVVVGETVRKVLSAKAARTVLKDLTGADVTGVTQIAGSWEGKAEPSFVLTGNMTYEQANELSKVLGFLFAQDATVVAQPWFAETEDQTQALLISQNKAMTKDQVQRLHDAASAAGVDYSTTVDGRGAKFLHFGDADGLRELQAKVVGIAKAAGLKEVTPFFVRSELNAAQTYLSGRSGSDLRGSGADTGGTGPSDIFRRAVDHVLVPYAKAVGAEGYSFSPDRYGERFGLTSGQVDYIRAALRPKSGKVLSAAPLLSGDEAIDPPRSNNRTKIPGVSKNDLMWSLQNRAAQIGFIEPGDYSPEAQKVIADALADDIAYALSTESGSTAVGWYDRALKDAKVKYATLFPEINTDPDRELMFDAVLGIASQGNDVFSNATFAGRVYFLVTRKGYSITRATKELAGTFGKNTKAIEQNLLKFEHLVNVNGYDKMRQVMNTKGTVSEIRAMFRKDKDLFGPDGTHLADKVKGMATQTVTGWMAFGPKIGSFINNLHGDYSTLTADLWFSRTWNRVTGFMFNHDPALEMSQVSDLYQAMLEEAKTGVGRDVVGLSKAQIDAIVIDPASIADFAERTHAMREYEYSKIKDEAVTPLRKKATLIAENRSESVALPRLDSERAFQQDTIEQVQRTVRRKTGTTLTIADIQAVLWYFEKELFAKFGVGDSKAKPADYEGAAARFIDRFNRGDLFYVEKPKPRYVIGEKGDYLTDGEVVRSARRAQTETPAFKEWFGDSKVVDADGQPLVVYHGTTANIEEGAFKPGTAPHDAGIFFTNRASVAGSVYAGGIGQFNAEAVRDRLAQMSDAEVENVLETLGKRFRLFDPWGRPDMRADVLSEMEDRFNEEGPMDALVEAFGNLIGTSVTAPMEGANIVPVYLALQNPLTVDGTGLSFDPEQQAEWLNQAKAGKHDGLIIRKYEDGGFGYDYNYRSAGRHDVFVAFAPEQIKSAVGNDGNFNPADPDILRSARRTQTETPAFKKWFGDSKVVDAEGGPLVVYHGTTNDFSVFDRSRGNPESDMGAGFYFSNTPGDVASNYAGEGPDLTNRIQQLAERIAQDEDLTDEESFEVARQRLSQGKPNTLPVFLALRNPVVLGGKDTTVFDYEEVYDSERDEYQEPVGRLVDFVEALRRVSQDHDFDGFDVEQVVADIFEGSEGEDLNSSDLIKVVKGSDGLVDSTFTDGDYALASSEIVRLALEEMGFDGVIDRTVNAKFGTGSRGRPMGGVSPSTTHYIAFRPDQIKSAVGNDGNFNPADPDIRRSARRTQTETPAFKEWFGDSKVVDADGAPLVVHHGGAKGITAFDKRKVGATFGYDKEGFFFTTERGQRPGTADNYAGADGEVYSVYLSMQNPYTLEQFAADVGVTVSDLLMQEQSPQSPITVFDTDRAEIMSRARLGYDGVAFQVDYGDGTNEGMFVAFDPAQIKSATGNDGNFNPSDPDIRRSARRAPDTPEFRNWFAESKMVDGKGAPITFMHGSPATFDAFDNAKLGKSSTHGSAGLGHFFTRDTSTAERYADGGQIYQGWLSLARPYVMPLEEAQSFETAADSAQRRAELQSRGYDGAVILDDQRKPWAFVTFEPWQFKSTDNSGAFDPFEDGFRRSARRAQGETPAFKTWFGADSNLRSPDGAPMVLYHGTTRDFTSFQPSATGVTGPGIYLGDSSDVAESYAGDSTGANVMPVYARGRYMGMTKWSKYVQDHGWGGARTAAEKDGWAGVYDEKFESAVNVWDPRNIKSATGNDGSFDGGSADLTRSARRVNTFGDITPEQDAALRAVGLIREPQTLAQRFSALTSDLGKRLTQGIVDQYAPLKELDFRAYVLARMSKGTDGTLEAAMYYGTPRISGDTFEIDTSTGGFMKMLSQLNGEQDRFLSWIAANRAEQLSAEGREFLFTPDQIRELKNLNQGTMGDGTARQMKYAQVLREFNAFQDAVLAISEARGLIDAESRQVWKDGFYVPFYRNMEDGTTGPSVKSGLVNQYAFKKLKGSRRQLNEDLLANTLQNMAHLLSAAAKNHASRAALVAAQSAGVAHRVPRGTKGAVRFLDGGREQHYLIDDPFIFDAITSLESVQVVGVEKVLSKFKHWLTLGVTINPTFQLRSLLRDMISAMAITDIEKNPFKNVATGIKSQFVKDQDYINALASGGLIRFNSLMEGDRAERTRKLIKMGVADSTILDTSEKVNLFLTKALDKYLAVGDISESTNRMALYKQLIAKGVDPLLAAYQSRDMMDFSMQGQWRAVRFLTQVVPFLNARLQGLYKLGRDGVVPTGRVLFGQGNATDKQIAKRFSAVTGAVAMASILLLEAFGDDEDWKKREDWDRDTYWWFKLGDTAYRIPKPFEVGAIGTIAERGWEYMTNDEMSGARLGARMGHMLSSTFSLNPIPQAVKPLLDVYANEDSFTKRPIESMGMERLKAEDRFTGNTSELAKWLGSMGLPEPGRLLSGEVRPLSPVQIDALIRGYFSWLGVSATRVVDESVRAVADRPAKPEMQLRDMFFAGNFAETLPANGSRYVTALYDQAKEIEFAYASYRFALRQGDSVRAQELMESDGAKIRMQPMANKAKQAMAKLNESIRSIERDTGMSPAEKRDRIDRVKMMQHQIAMRVSVQLEQ
jgi:hypothetical protein